MPSGLKRFQMAQSLHFITFSCFHRLPLLEAPGAMGTFEAVLEEIRARYQARAYVYVLMPEHVHLLVNEPPRILLAQFLKSVKQITSRKLRGPREKIWQDRYYDSNVRGEKAPSEVIRYIHRNPVKRGLVAKPEDWQWSSFRHYATGVAGAVEIESHWTAARRGNQLPESPIVIWLLSAFDRATCPGRLLNRNVDRIQTPFNIENENGEKRLSAEREWIFIGSYGFNGAEVLLSRITGRVQATERRSSRLIAEWTGFESYLQEEIKRLSQFFDEGGKLLVEKKYTVPGSEALA